MRICLLAVGLVGLVSLSPLLGAQTGLAEVDLDEARSSGWTEDAAGVSREAPRRIHAAREAGIGSWLGVEQVVTLDGSPASLSRLAADGALVVALRDVDCPLSRRYGPRLAELEARFTPRGVAFLHLDVSTIDTGPMLAGALADSGLRGPAVLDPGGTVLGRALRAATTTEVFVLDRARTLRYRGAIDDQYGLGYAAAAPTETFLADALEAVLEGRDVTVPATTAPGCLLDLDPAPAKPGGVTYHEDVARILQANCVTCHRAGGSGPFALDSYEQARERARMIAFAVDEGLMPPWHARAGVGGPWANDRALTDDERTRLVAWAEAGAPAGDRAHTPLARSFPGTWQFGEPDAVFEMPRDYAVPADGVVDYQYVYVKTDLPEDRWVRAVEVLPGALQVVHHVLVFEEEPRRDGESSREHNGRFRGGLHGYFAGYVPGQGMLDFGEGRAKRLPAGAWLKFQMHYTPNGTAASDRTRIGFWFADGPPEHELRTNSIATTRFEIPAGEDHHVVRAGLEFETASTLAAFSPHMHFRGKSFRFEATYPDGTTEVLLDVPGYDFNWQTMYRLAEPITVPAGTRLIGTAAFDNSAGNPANPDPTRPVRFGEQTWDEMMIGYFEWWKAESTQAR